ncbi:MAG: hypothetical protein AAF491_07175 [Verrucomicrobiota bacterium]
MSSNQNDVPYPEIGGHWTNSDGTRRTDIIAVRRNGHETTVTLRMPGGTKTVSLQDYSERAERTLRKGGRYHEPITN